jgi:hypothetical protein
MSRSTAFLLSALAGAAICVAVVLAFVTLPGRPESSSGAWPATQRANFIEACVESCRKAPGVTPDRFSLCDQSCKCAADEGEKLLPGGELTEIYLAYQKGNASPEQGEKLRKLQDAGLACARKFK